MSKTTTIARMRRDGAVVEVQPDGGERPFPDTPMRPMTEAEVKAAAAGDPDSRPFTPEELAKAKRIPRARTLRRALGLTQEEFAERYRIPLGTLRDWEQGRSEPDQPARAYLTVIARDPEGVRRAIEAAPGTPTTLVSTQMTAYAQLQTLNLLPATALQALPNPDSLGILTQTLTSIFSPTAVTAAGPKQRTWELVGLVYRDLGRHHDALSIFRKLYDQMLTGQQETSSRCHKGMPLCWMSDCYFAIGYPFMSLRYVVLTLVEDAISDRGSVLPEKTGVYWRLVLRGWLSEEELQRYADKISALHRSYKIQSFYPEWVLQKLDRDWITWTPTPQEAGIFSANVHYLKYLVGCLGDKSGRTLEVLADYLLSCMPGCRTALLKRSYAGEYDLVCSAEGLDTDFRSELGRYFVCECKDWNAPADFTTIAKFCSVLDSINSRFGILFSKHGITGKGKREHAELQQLMIHQHRGIIIVIFDQHDLQRLTEGVNFISLLRSKYEKVRLNLRGETPSREPIGREKSKKTTSRRSSRTPRS